MACSAALVLFAWPSGLFAGKDLGGVDFARDIRPLLSDNCFACHGPDAKQRKADLRLDTREGALADLDGTSAVVPGKPSESEAYRRITTADADDLMPPPDSGRALTDSEKELVRRWIEQGAKWQNHWAFIPAKRPGLPLGQARAGRGSKQLGRGRRTMQSVVSCRTKIEWRERRPSLQPVQGRPGRAISLADRGESG